MLAAIREDHERRAGADSMLEHAIRIDEEL
jgi:hypothetical protein